MQYICVLLMGMLFLWLAGYVRNEEIRFVRSLVLTFVFYFMLYVLVCSAMFALDIFLIKYAVIGTSVICVIYFLVSFSFVLGRKCQIDKKWVSESDSNVSFALISLLAILTWGNFGFFGMGSDQGVYPTQAINFYYDKTETYQDIEEYYALEDTEYKEFYQKQVEALGGYDLLIEWKNIPTNSVSNGARIMEGIWHGIPTYSAILGLSAKIFGLENMSFIGFLFYLSLLCTIEFILVDLNLSCWIRRGAILLLGISPQVIWIKNSTLTESFLAVLIVVYIYYILHGEKSKRFFSVLPIVTFSFFHVTVFTMMPIFILIYTYRFILEREKMYLTCIRIISSAYLLGFFMMLKVQPMYTLLKNYQQGFRFLSPEQIIVVAFVGSCLGIISSYIIPYIKIRENTIKIICKLAFCVVGIVAIVYLAFMGLIRFNTWGQIRSMTLVCYSVLTGVFIIPYILYVFIVRKYNYSIEVGVVGLLFSWCIVFYSIVMRRNIPHYYYYSRYLMPYLSIVIILFSLLIIKQKIYFMFIIVGLLILTPYTMTIKSRQDNTYIQWDILSTILREIDAENVVILDTDLMNILYYPMRAAGAKVYPIYETLENTLNYIDTGGKAIYISKNKEENLSRWISVNYRDYAEIRLNSNLDCRSIILGLPAIEAMKTEIYPITIYQYNEQIIYENNYLLGWKLDGSSGYRWMCAEDAYLECFLRKEDQQIIIHPGYIIPFSSIKRDKITVDVYLNDTFLGTIDWTEKNAEKDKVLDIPSEYITDGCNIVHFVSNLWSPTEYGEEDKNTYSFSVELIEFKKIGK